MTKKYDAVWETLKASINTGKLSVTLAVPPPLQKLVIKEVIRCKDLDVVFKYECNLLRKTYRISYTAKSAQLKIFLTENINTKNLSIEEL